MGVMIYLVKIFVIDNGGQWTHREWRTLKYLDVDTKIVSNTTLFEDLNNQKIDGLILSGGTPRIGLEDNLGKSTEYLLKADFPILGICAGHQFIARYYGGEVKPSRLPEFGKVELILINEEDSLLKGIPKKSIVWESHNDEVTLIPNNFSNLGKSDNCEIQIIKHKNKSIYGLQFHPEVEHTEYGVQIFKNFINLCY